jgi:hypothetical protein
MDKQLQTLKFVVCIKNDDYVASLDVAKLYRVLPDAKATQHGLIRVIDESGEDYLYSQSYFMPIELPQPLIAALAWAA